jgi:hypothetical protein
MDLKKGSPAYMAPELDREECGPEEMAAEQQPFVMKNGRRMNIFQVRKAMAEHEMPREMEQEMKDLVTACWEMEPVERPRFDEIVDHPEWVIFPETNEIEQSGGIYSSTRHRVTF